MRVGGRAVVVADDAQPHRVARSHPCPRVSGDAGSLAGAARRLRRSPPSITRALAELEARRGTRLLERTTRRLTPTERGKTFGADARRVLSAYEEALREGAEAAHGLLRLTAPLMFGRRHVTPVLASFLAAYPAMQAELRLADHTLDLLEEGLDLALRIGPPAQALPPPLRIGAVRRVVVASPAYLAAHGEPRVPADLARHAVVHVAGRPVPSEWRFRRRERVVRLAPRLTVSEIEAALVAVRAGHGITRVLSYQVADELAAGTLVRLLRAYEPPPLPVTLVTAAPTPRHACAPSSTTRRRGCRGCLWCRRRRKDAPAQALASGKL